MGRFITLMVLVAVLATVSSSKFQPKKDTKAAVQIIVDNRRDSATTVNCCSADDDLCQKPLESNRYYNFAFTPSILGNTVFTCRAIFGVVEDAAAPTIRTFSHSWTAYAEREDTNQGSAIFELRDDGIYWDNNFMATWENSTTFPPILGPVCPQHTKPCDGA